jgi:hypothetical protein
LAEVSEALVFGVGLAVEGGGEADADADADAGFGVDLVVAELADFEGVTDGLVGEIADGLANLN